MATLTAVFTGDGFNTSSLSPEGPFAFRVKQLNASDIDAEVVGFQLSGSFNGATATWQVCMDETVSPQVWTNANNGAFTSATADNLILTAGVIARLNISGSGSPLPSIKVTVRGQIQAVNFG